MIGSSKALLQATAGAGASGGWDISAATYNAVIPRFFVTSQESTPNDVFFKSDGTKMYIVGSSGDKVNEYDLSTAWDITTASFLQYFSVSSQEISPQGIFFKSDGTKMYIIGTSGDDVNEYNLSTAWDISTASYSQNKPVGGQETTPNGIFFKSDGTRMYITGSSGDDVNEYSLSTAWDISTVSFSRLFSVSSQETTPTGIHFKSDGTKMYIIGTAGDDVNEYNLSTAWDISTASYSQNFSVQSQDTSPSGVFFKPDGTKMYISGYTNDAVYAYDLSTAWDISTAVWPAPTSRYFSVIAQETAPNGIFFKSDGTKMYVVGAVGDDVNEYNLSAAWDISTASYSQSKSVASQESTPTGLFFKSDGTKMYITGSNGDEVNEYDLSTAWDVSTASYLQTFSVASQESSPQAIFFKSDGTKMYIIGISGDDVNEYNLSTAWDISTAAYSQKKSVAAQELSPSGIFFKPDGTKMYITGYAGDDVNEYDLSTAWDISTFTYLQNFSVAAQEAIPIDLFFKYDGTKMYILGLLGDAVYEYDL